MDITVTKEGISAKYLHQEIEGLGLSSFRGIRIRGDQVTAVFQNNLTPMSDEKKQVDFLDFHPDASRRPTVAALNVRFFTEKPNVEILVKCISPRS